MICGNIDFAQFPTPEELTTFLVSSSATFRTAADACRCSLNRACFTQEARRTRSSTRHQCMKSSMGAVDACCRPRTWLRGSVRDRQLSPKRNRRGDLRSSLSITSGDNYQ
jgi:hypothetical protein